MYNNEYMYAIERSDEYLAHYGVRGMRWGVRKAIASGNSARLGRQYAKAQKKLAKLEKQAGKSKKYARRAALMGAGAAAAGGLAAAGTEGVGKAIRKVGGFAGRTSSNVGSAMMKSKNSNIRKAGLALHNAGRAANGGIVKAGLGVESWGNSKSIGNAASKTITKARQGLGKNALGNPVAGAMSKSSHALKGMSNNTIARIGAGAVGAGLAVGAARNAYKAATAQKKAAQFKSEMNKAFAGTKYANNGGNRQGGKKRKRR